jgi:hypothetical protein
MQGRFMDQGVIRCNYTRKTHKYRVFSSEIHDLPYFPV